MGIPDPGGTIIRACYQLLSVGAKCQGENVTGMEERCTALFISAGFPEPNCVFAVSRHCPAIGREYDLAHPSGLQAGFADRIPSFRVPEMGRQTIAAGSYDSAVGTNCRITPRMDDRSGARLPGGDIDELRNTRCRRCQQRLSVRTKRNPPDLVTFELNGTAAAIPSPHFPQACSLVRACRREKLAVRTERHVPHIAVML
jgi:hypothetical protein